MAQTNFMKELSKYKLKASEINSFLWVFRDVRYRKESELYEYESNEKFDEAMHCYSELTEIRKITAEMEALFNVLSEDENGEV